MPPLFLRRPSAVTSMSSSTYNAGGEWSPTRTSHFDHHSLFGGATDPEAASVRSHLSTHAPDQALLLPARPPPTTRRPAPARAQTQRLQRRRNQYYYSNGLLVPVVPPATTTTTAVATNRRPSSSSSPRQARPRAASSQQQPESSTPRQRTAPVPPKRAKPYLQAASGSSAPSWLLSGERRQSSWTGERRESRKLQKDHPAGSARPSCTVEIPEEYSGGGGGGGGGGSAEDASGGERDGGGVRGSVLGVRRRMEKLRGFYRRGEKEAGVIGSLR